MKKSIILLITLFIPFCLIAKNNANNLTSVEKELMTKIELEKVFSINRSTGSGPLQNMKITNKYIFFSQSKRTGDAVGDNSIIVLDRETKKVVKTIKYNIGHGNDITYNNRTREVMFLKSVNDFVSIVCFDYDTLEHTRDIVVEGIKDPYTISYNNDNNSYYIANLEKGYILDGLFQIISSFDIKTNQTIQSFSYYDGYLYYSTFEAGGANGYQKKYDGVFNPFDSVIYVFDINGKFVKGFYVPPIKGQLTEIEGMSFYNGEAFFVFNNWQTAKIDVYKYNGKLLPLKNDITNRKEDLVLSDFKDMEISNSIMYIVSIILVCLVSATIIFIGNRKVKDNF